ncbi:MAG: HDIG domain-containing metalloprotein [Phycisphaeraceae bacterium]
MIFSRSKSVRRREVRRTLPRSGEHPWLRALSKPLLWAGLWALGFTFFASLIALGGHDGKKHQIGEVIDRTVVARVAFDAVDQEGTLEARNIARGKEPAVYNANLAYIEKVRNALHSLGRLGADKKIETQDQIPTETRNALMLSSYERFAELKRYFANPSNLLWDKQVEHIMSGLTSIAILRTERAQIEQNRSDLASRILVRHPNPERGLVAREDEDLIDIKKDLKPLELRLESLLATRLPQAVQRVVIDIIMSDLQPTYVFDLAETDRRRAAAEKSVGEIEMKREPNQVLVIAGTQLSPQLVLLLEKEQSEYDRQMGVYRWLIRGGNLGLILLIAVGLWVYVAAYNPRILQNPVRGGALVVLLLMSQGLAVALTVAWPTVSYATATFPAVLATMVLAIAYDRRFALAVGAITSLLILVSLELTVGFSIVLLTGVTIAASRLPDVRHRSSLVLAGLWTAAGMFIASFLVGLQSISLQNTDLLDALFRNAAWAAAGAIVTGLLVQGLLPAIEKAFKVTTAMTLKDLNDASHPLLRRLAEEAPGTYQHSLRIADMAETAAENIGANGLLCRVGAMYHDIGKINKPMYFVENQAGGPNKHDKLSPAMSLLIILGHVKDGVEMAREYKLPRSVVHFIDSHHGTTLVEYFYHAARKKSEHEEAPMPTEFEFRYPGPKPQTKEAAILLLCDCVEGAARALPEPTPVRLEQLVHKMLNKRLMDGQFDECHITLQELHKVEVSVTKMLTAIYHGRIAYPKAAGEGPTQPAPRPAPLQHASRA